VNYDEAVRYLMTLGSELAAPRQPAPRGAVKFGLRNISVLADRLGHPHQACPCAHVAGTNGKGSTAAMLDSILRAAGLRTGLYTSPHLERINERIRIDGREISDAAFAEAFTRVQAYIEVMLASGTLPAHPTFFECLTAMAFDVFAREKFNFAVFEVGMGGRLDATNIVMPEVAVITQIDFDHENYLGHSIEEIAGEKAGIIKPGIPVVSAAERPEARDVIRRRCAEQDAALVEVDEVYRAEWEAVRAGLAPPESVPAQTFVVREASSGWQIRVALPLLGRYQVRNALAAVAAARELSRRGFPISDQAIARGLATVHWPGRLELLQEQPAVFLDGTHNPAGARELLAFWHENFSGRKIHLVYGAVRDKAVDEITSLLFPQAAAIILTQPRHARAISAAALREMTAHLAVPIEVVPDPAAALRRAIERAAPDDAVFATGSLYLAGDLRRAWLAEIQAGAATAAGRAAQLAS